MDQQLFKKTQFFMIHILKDILKKQTQFYTFFLWRLGRPQVLNNTDLISNCFLKELFYALIFFHSSTTHLKCFSLLTNVSVELLCVFAVSSQLWGYVEVLILQFVV